MSTPLRVRLDADHPVKSAPNHLLDVQPGTRSVNVPDPIPARCGFVPPAGRWWVEVSSRSTPGPACPSCFLATLVFGPDPAAIQGA